MKTYYQQRAPYYDRVYAIEERQSDLRLLEQKVVEVFRGKRVLELACGTGYWTQFIARTASHVQATDLLEETIALAQQREGNESAHFQTANALDLASSLNPANRFNALFAGLWVSHIPKPELELFFKGAHQFLEPGATVVIIDNSKTQLKALPISETDELGNTYQLRTLDNGNKYKVLKNFPGENELIESIGNAGKDFDYRELDHFWWLKYTRV